jgi:hypothetical protein
LLFGGMDSLKSTSRANQQQMADGHAQRVEPPADHNMPALPGAPK